jgi:hypothetical protein
MTRFGRVAVLVCAILAPAFSGTGVAQAATNLNGICEAGEFCLYDGSDSTGRAVDLGVCDPTYTDIAFDNRASSWWNRLNSPVRLYEDSNYRGTPTDLPPRSRGSLANTPIDNAASSHRALDAICVPS